MLLKSSPAANKRENVLDSQITLDDFLGNSTDFSTSFDLAVKLLIITITKFLNLIGYQLP